ncbi:MAG: DnaJ domain-containing protein [Metamycoplasmataceae bacterium]
MERTYYDILGVKPTVDGNDLKKAYYKKAKLYHPDICKDKDAGKKFEEVNSAYEILSDPKSRKEYDQELLNNTTNKSNNASVQKEQRKQQETHSIYSIIDSFLNRNESVSYYTQVINENFKSFESWIMAFNYFWMTFWIGGQKSINSIKYKNTKKIYRAFIESSLFISIEKKINLLILTNVENKTKLEKIKAFIEEKNQKLSSLLKQNPNKAFVYILKTINNKNFFDKQSDTWIFLILNHDVMKLFELFSKVDVKNEEFKTPRKWFFWRIIKRIFFLILFVIIISSLSGWFFSKF